MPSKSQFRLLGQRRFLPFYLTQFSGAFNDNLFKNALLLLITFSAGGLMGLSVNVVVNLAAFLFILPFFLFSGIAGEMADRYEKSRIIRNVKLAEIVIMAVAALGLWFGWYELLLVLLFLMGTQSTFFGPVKYAILPQVLADDELVGGNGLVGMGTFVAILLGTIAAGLLMGFEMAARLTAVAVFVMAVRLSGGASGSGDRIRWFRCQCPFSPGARNLETDGSGGRAPAGVAGGADDLLVLVPRSRLSDPVSQFCPHQPPG